MNNMNKTLMYLVTGYGPGYRMNKVITAFTKKDTAYRFLLDSGAEYNDSEMRWALGDEMMDVVACQVTGSPEDHVYIVAQIAEDPEGVSAVLGGSYRLTDLVFEGGPLSDKGITKGPESIVIYRLLVDGGQYGD